MTLSLHESSPHMHTLVSRPPHRPPFVVRASHAPLAPRHRTIGCGCSEPYMVQHLHGLVRRERRRRDRRERSAQRPGGSWGRATPAVSAADITAAGMPPPIAANGHVRERRGRGGLSTLVSVAVGLDRQQCRVASGAVPPVDRSPPWEAGTAP